MKSSLQKRVIFLPMIVIALFILLGTSCQDESNWVAKIDRKRISIDEYDQVFNMVIKQYTSAQMAGYIGAIDPMDPEIRDMILDDMINQRLIHNDLIERKFDKDPQWGPMLKQVVQDAIAQYYVTQQFEGRIVVTTDEAADWFDLHQAELAMMNPNLMYAEPDQLITIASQQLYLEKVQQRVEEIVEDARGEIITEYNTNALLPLGEGEEYKPGDWVARINGQKFTREDFDIILSLYIDEGNIEDLSLSDPDFIGFDSDDPADRKLFLDKLLESRIVYYKAKKDGFLTEDEHKFIVSYLELTTMNQIFILDLFKDDIVITQADIVAFVEDNKYLYPELAAIAQGGIDAAEAEQLEAFLMNQELELKLNDYLDTLRNAHQIIKNKEAYMPMAFGAEPSS